jgi:hypothetical protein
VTGFGRVLRTGLSSLRDRAASRLAALRFNPSRWLAFIALTVLAASYGLLLIGYTITAVIWAHNDSALYSLVTFAIQMALYWAFVCLCLAAMAVRPY